jgi:ABC-type uncharacterized transport system involved in gliding motility auxiliary subunit
MERLRELGFMLLLLSVVGAMVWVNQIYSRQIDWTWRQRSSLSEASVQVLKALEGPVHVRAFARERDIVRSRIRRHLERYQQLKPDLTLEFVNPDLRPDLTRRLGIRVNGELVVSYQGRDEHVRELSERAFTGVLHRLSASAKSALQFVTGHGERSPVGHANFDLGEFADAAREQGLQVEVLTPDNADRSAATDAVLVLAGPKSALLDSEIDYLTRHLDQGGNLLWLLDPGMSRSLQPVLDKLGIGLLPGVVVDATTRTFGIDDPAFALVTRYPSHPVTDALEAVTLFPRAAGLEVDAQSAWRAQPLLQTLEHSWTEIGEIDGKISYDHGTVERAGPITLGLALTRERDGNRGEQRVLVIGDGDFLANSHLGNGGNLLLGLNLVNWLATTESAAPLVNLQAAPDQRLDLSDQTLGAIALVVLIALPFGMALIGSVVLIRRRRQRRSGLE